MDEFTNPNPRELSRYTDEELVSYLRTARDRGAREAVGVAWSVLQFRHQNRVRAKVALKLPAAYVDDTTQDVLIAAWDAVSGDAPIQNLRAWLNRVIANHLADFWRGRSGKEVNTVREGVELDDDRGYQVADDGGFDGADLGVLVEQVLARRNPRHQEVVRLSVFEGCNAKEVSDTTGETEANVYQVTKRFRDELRAAIAGSNEAPTQDRT